MTKSTTQLTHSQSYTEISIQPSVLGLIDIDVRQDIANLTEAQSDERKRDAGAVLVRKPISVLNALGSLVVKVCELGSYCRWFGDRHFIVPLNAAVSGLGIVLCVAELVIGAVGLKRAHDFRSQFVYTKPPESVEDQKQMVAWAAKVERTASQILKNNSNNWTMQEVQRAAEALKGREITVEQAADLRKKMVHADLQHLRTVYLEADPAQKEKLLTRLGVGFVTQAEQHLNQLLNELDRANGIDAQGRPLENSGMTTDGEDARIEGVDSERLVAALEKAEHFLDLMLIQVDKKRIGHMIAMVGATVILVGLILGMTALCPWWIPVALLVAGSAIGAYHLFYWISYGNSEGWNSDFGKWIDTQRQSIREGISALSEVMALKMLPDAMSPV